MWGELASDPVDDCAKGSSGILFGHGNTLVDEGAEFGGEDLHVGQQHLDRGMLAEIGQTCTSVGLHSVNLVVEASDHSRQHLLMEGLGELSLHVVCELANAVQRCMSYLGVWMLKVLD